MFSFGTTLRTAFAMHANESITNIPFRWSLSVPIWSCVTNYSCCGAVLGARPGWGLFCWTHLRLENKMSVPGKRHREGTGWVLSPMSHQIHDGSHLHKETSCHHLLLFSNICAFDCNPPPPLTRNKLVLLATTSLVWVSCLAGGGT